jgi:hypothetical protein
MAVRKVLDALHPKKSQGIKALANPIPEEKRSMASCAFSIHQSGQYL